MVAGAGLWSRTLLLLRFVCIQSVKSLFHVQDAVVVQLSCSVVSQAACCEFSCSVASAQGVAQKLQQRWQHVQLAINDLR